MSETSTTCIHDDQPAAVYAEPGGGPRCSHCLVDLPPGTDWWGLRLECGNCDRHFRPSPLNPPYPLYAADGTTIDSYACPRCAAEARYLQAAARDQARAEDEDDPEWDPHRQPEPPLEIGRP